MERTRRLGINGGQLLRGAPCALTTTGQKPQGTLHLWKDRKLRCQIPLLTVALALSLTLSIGCQRPAPPPDRPSVIPVEVTVITPTMLDETTVLVGVLDAYRAVDVVSEVSGKIATLYHDVGDGVRAGTPLASLQKAVLRETLNQAEAALLAAQARYELSRNDFARDSTLFAHGDIAEAAMDASRTVYTASLADLKARRAGRELAARDLREADIRAPFTGVVARRYGDIGAFVASGTSLFRIVDIDSLRLVLSVAQRHVGRLARGREVSVTAEALGDKRFTGRIRSISPEADENTRTFPVEIVLANPPGRPLRDGLVVRATLVLGTIDQAIAVPREAIIKRTGGEFVFVVSDSVAHQRSVQVGAMIGDRYVIEDGLQPEERLVIVGAQNLHDGAQVVIEQEVSAGKGGAAES
jgi:multidrug efflux system membrane fusion protein